MLDNEGIIVYDHTRRLDSQGENQANYWNQVSWEDVETLPVQVFGNILKYLKNFQNKGTIKQNPAILELCCGNGSYTKNVLKHLNGRKVNVCDLSHAALMLMKP